MRKIYNVSVNGTSYQVEVEELNEVPVQQSAPAQPVQQAAPVQQTAPAAPAQNAPQGGTKVVAPMPGVIKKVAVHVGDKVENNGLLLILEAMKLENEIYAPCAGTITSVNVKENNMVNAGDLMMTIG